MQLTNSLAVVSLLCSIGFATPSNIKERSRPSNNCGVKGYDGNRNILKQYPYTTQSQCDTYCAKNPKCQAYGLGNGYCRLYSVSCLSFIQRDNRSPFTFYDKTCPCPPVKPTTTSSKCTSKTSLSTTKSTKTSSSTTKSTTKSTTASV